MTYLPFRRKILSLGEFFIVNVQFNLLKVTHHDRKNAGYFEAVYPSTGIGW